MGAKRVLELDLPGSTRVESPLQAHGPAKEAEESGIYLLIA
jgi:hypothetical protein